MMPCSKETLAKLFYSSSTSFFLLFLFFYFSSNLFSKLFHFLSSNPVTHRTDQNGFEAGWSSEEEDYDEVDRYFQADSIYMDQDHLVADIIRGGEALMFIKNAQSDPTSVEDFTNHYEPVYEDSDENSVCHEKSHIHSSPASESTIMEDAVEEEIPQTNADPVESGRPTSPTIIELNKSDFMRHDQPHDEEFVNVKSESEKEINISRDEKFIIFAPSQFDNKKFQAPEKNINGEIHGDTCTVGSTSKSSSEWRSSTLQRDSMTDDPFSSSSRRSCPKWESYTVFQKYDEEMMFLDRISAQKLHETESLRSIQSCPRSISERIVHKLAARNKSPSDGPNNPYHELEAAYVAQICLTWEALNWSYKSFQSKRASRGRESDPGCPAGVAQQFQQFQVLLQRYVENEPYEHGRRPEIYARMRKMAPKLLLVPEYRDSEDEQKEEGFESRISSGLFLIILEDGIRTFMNFLKADRENRCQVLKSLFRRNQVASIDPTLLLLTKKSNRKKKLKLKDFRRAGKCSIRKRSLKEEEEMEILMSLIDLKVVSRVLRMADIREEQLHWCEEKMGKVRVWEGKLQRDSTALFFPAH